MLVMTNNIDTAQFNETTEKTQKAKSNRGRKKKYATDEERILTHRQHHK